MDDYILDVLESYSEKVAADLTAAGAPLGRVIPLAPGVTPAWDDCCDGQLYGRVVSISPAADGTVRGAAASGVRCGVHFWVATVALAIVRCVAVVDNNGRAPTASAIAADGVRILRDAAALERRILCGDWTRSIVQGAPLAEEGGCAGFEWIFTLRAPVCACLPDPLPED